MTNMCGTEVGYMDINFVGVRFVLLRKVIIATISRPDNFLELQSRREGFRTAIMCIILCRIVVAMYRIFPFLLVLLQCTVSLCIYVSNVTVCRTALHGGRPRRPAEPTMSVRSVSNWGGDCSGNSGTYRRGVQMCLTAIGSPVFRSSMNLNTCDHFRKGYRQ